MRPSLRFLGLAVVGWVGVRAAALGVLPGAELFHIERGEPKAPPIVPTQFPAIEPVALAAPPTAPEQYYPAAYAPQPVRPVMVPVYYAAQVSAPMPTASSRTAAAANALGRERACTSTSSAATPSRER